MDWESSSSIPNDEAKRLVADKVKRNTNPKDFLKQNLNMSVSYLIIFILCIRRIKINYKHSISLTSILKMMLLMPNLRNLPKIRPDKA